MKVGFINSIISSELDSFPIGLVSLCTVLKDKGIPSKIIDFAQLYYSKVISDRDLSENNIERYAEIICKEAFSVISFYTMANSYHISLKIAEQVKKIAPDCIIIFAGPQATVCGEDTLHYFPFIDLIALGEGEQTIYETVINAHAKKFDKCPNALIRQGDKIVKTQIVSMIDDLNELPFLDYSYVPYVKEFNTFPIEVGRGCPFRCKFCSTKGFWNQQYRLKSSSRIVQEIKYVQKQFGIEQFSFEHDSLTANRKCIVKFCNDLIGNELGITWGCSSRVDVLDNELITLLSKAGCKNMFLGIESGSPFIQKKINKNLNLERVIPTIKLLKENGIDVTCSFIYGFPDETEKDLSQTLTMISQLISVGVKHIQIHKLTILRGTEFYEQFKDRLKVIDTTGNFNAGGDGKQFEAFIKSYPEIFPQFFNVEGVLHDNSHIECFVNNILKLLTGHYPNTYRVITARYHENLYRLYQDMISCCEKLEIETYQSLNGMLKDWRMEEKIKGILEENFFDTRWKNDHFMIELFRFESEYLRWIKNPDVDFKKTYRYDLYEFIAGSQNVNPQPQMTQLSITIQDNHAYLQRKYTT